MIASDTNLHPLGKAIEPGEIQFTLRRAANPGETFGVECVYRPYRARDLKKTRHLNLLRGWIGGGSLDLIRTQEEESHSVRETFQSTGTTLDFKVSLHDPDKDHPAYQLASVRLVGGVTGTLEFQRWFAETPPLDPGFGLTCEKSSLGGVLRPSGIGSQPLRGSFPLWPTLRSVDVEFLPVEVPTVRLFEATAKHHWDGWRQTTPAHWPGGRTIVLRHVKTPTVWREHEYNAFPPGRETVAVRPAPPQGVLPGVQLEVFWPEGDHLEFPETRFDRDVQLNAVPLSKLPPRMRELLAQSVHLRPGWEPASISAKEWHDLEESVPEIDMPLAIEMAPSAGSQTVLKISRKAGFKEPWVCTFGTAYDDGRRVVLTSLLVKPERWNGPLPE